MTQTHIQPRILRGPLTRALVLENPHPSLDERLRKDGFEVQRIDAPPSDEASLIKILQEGKHQVIYKRSRVEITRRVVESAPDLHAVMLCCIGDDSVDKQACAEAGVLVMNDPISNGRSVVELVIGEMLCMGRRVFEAVQETNQHQWHKNNRARYELKGKTLSIIGLGNIGKQVAQVGQMLGMDIVFYDNREVAREVGETLGWRAASSLQDALEVAHVVSIHVSASDYRRRSNAGLLTRELLMTMGTRQEVPGPVLFLNAARGVVHSAEDLIAAVDEGPIDFAFVDVFPEEPHHKGAPWSNPYANHNAIYSTPHIGAATQEAQPRIACHMARTTRLLNQRGFVRDSVFCPRVPIGLQDVEGSHVVLSVVHSDSRGTKKAIDEAIYESGLSNLSSAHRDFPHLKTAYDVSALDSMPGDDFLDRLLELALKYTGETNAIRSVRLIESTS